MTSQYVTEPPTSGLVHLITSKGTIPITLFSHETPLACRNFLTLALEGFYDNLLFHRLIPNFILQTGDPSGTGLGGESIYGEPFPVESHSRLKFSRRGLLGMAASDEKTNESQFFLTLDATPELQGKHTLMGKVEGKGIYTLMELAEGVELVEGDRPRYAIRLKEVRVVENPFDDLKPRVTKQQRKEEERARKEEEQKRREEEERRKRGKAKKNTALLSFGAEEEGEEMVLKGPKSSHDLLQDQRLSKETMASKVKKVRRVDEGSTSAHVAAGDIRSQDASSSSSVALPPASAPYTNGASHSSSEPSSDAVSKPITKPTNHPSSARDFLTSQRAKYLSPSTSSTTSKEDSSYSALLSFQSRLRTQPSSSSSSALRPAPAEIAVDDDEEEAKEYGASDDDDDWRSHRLDAGGRPLQPSAGGKDRVEDYEVLDPRDHKKKVEERGKREGKRGRDWVEDERRYRDDRRSFHDDRVRAGGSRTARHGEDGTRYRSSGDGDRWGRADRDRGHHRRN
ncbi:putative Peptidyl-prolyl cis-trans isomerase B (putative) [Pseudozyma hubeiensis]|nr:putative Peptidyl-prolyl cis-trans isomerase B (putative) [Pseudozyma hubeiensis]